MGDWPYESIRWEDDISNYSLVPTTQVSAIGSNVLHLSTTTGLTVGQRVNIISTITNKFSTSTDVNIIEVSPLINSVTVSSTLTSALVSGSSVEFWTHSSSLSILDNIVEGGTWNPGPSPSNLIINGSSFLVPDISYASDIAPEELVPGHVSDSVGISVYTMDDPGVDPVVFTNNIDILKNVVTTKT